MYKKNEKTALISVFCIILIIIAFSLTLKRAIWLGMDVNPGYWAGEAIPGAISDIVFDNKIKYTTNATVTDEYKKELVAQSTINRAIEKSLNLDKTKIGKEVYILFGNDDKGILDFVTLSFRVFGFKVESILYFYFFILFVSCTMYICSFFYYPMRLFLMLTFWIMLFLVLPMIKFHGQLVSVVALRAIPVLGIIPTLHLLFLVFRARYKISDLLFMATQASIIIFTLHIRSTTYWQIAAVGMACFISIFFQLYHTRFGTKTNYGYSKKPLLLLPFILLFVGYLGLQEYRELKISPEFEKVNLMTTRTIWHNIYTGFAFEPEFAHRYKLRIDDISIFDATEQYLKEQGREDEWVSIGGTSLNFTRLHWNQYDEMVKEMLFARCASYPFSCFRAIFYYKPLSLAHNLGWLYGLQHSPPDMDIDTSNYFGDVLKQQRILATEKMDENKLRAYLWSPISILLLMPLIFLIRFPSDNIALLCLLLLCVGSLVPSILGYPVPHTIVDTAIVVGMLVYTLIAFFVKKIYSYTSLKNIFEIPHNKNFGFLKNFNKWRI
jgi:hypothetical protein